MFLDIVILGIGIFLTTQIVHILAWRISTPRAYPIWLLVFFIFLPYLVGALYLGFAEAASVDTLVGGFLLHTALSGVYMTAYPGIIHFSPSLEILKKVQRHMPEGLPESELNLPFFNEDNLLGMRIDNLSAGKLITVEKNQTLTLLPKGRLFARLFLGYRRFLGLPLDGGG